MATATESRYGQLLAETRPRVITTETENARAIARLDALDSLGRPLTREERLLADLLTALVQQFEAARYPLRDPEPLEALHELMEARGIRQRDLIEVFGSSSVASDVLNGKRDISKAHAKKLAEFFHVPVSLFI